MIRVLHLISSVDFLGAERVVCELAQAIDKARFCIHVGLIGSPAAVEDAFDRALSAPGLVLINFTCRGKFSPECLSSIGRYVVKNRIDLIHSHGYKSDIFAFGSIFNIDTKVKLVATNHNWMMKTFQERLYKFLDIRVLRRFHKIAAVSDEVKEEMVRHSIPGGVITVIDNGISTEFIEDAQRSSLLRLELGLKEDDVVIGCVASLTTEKAHQDLIRAFLLLHQKIRGVKLLLIGDGPLRRELQAFSDSFLPVDSVIFAGRRCDVNALYDVCDLFALVSHREGLPMAMLEAMAAGLPVVVSAVGAIPQVIHHGENGFLIEKEDIPAIADALHLLVQNPTLRQTIGSRARQTVVERYSRQRMARDYQQLYLEALGRA